MTQINLEASCNLQLDAADPWNSFHTVVVNLHINGKKYQSPVYVSEAVFDLVKKGDKDTIDRIIELGVER